MTTLADLKQDQQFLFACQVISSDTSGITLALYGPGRVQAATAIIGPDGTMTGSLAAPANQVPVNLVTGFIPLSVGDVLQNNDSGETSVCQWSAINPDGTVVWSSSPSHRVVYPAAGWSVIGHVNL
jgi:hypothetical protein